MSKQLFSRSGKHPRFDSTPRSNWTEARHVWIDLHSTIFFTLPHNIKVPPELTGLFIINSPEMKLNFFLRPGMYDFFIFCKSRFDTVNIWSNVDFVTTKWIVSNIIESPVIDIANILCIDDLNISRRYFGEYKSTKYITKLWPEMKEEEIIVIDDSIHISENKTRGIKVKPFIYQPGIDINWDDILKDNILEELEKKLTIHH